MYKLLTDGEAIDGSYKIILREKVSELQDSVDMRGLLGHEEDKQKDSEGFVSMRDKSFVGYIDESHAMQQRTFIGAPSILVDSYAMVGHNLFYIKISAADEIDENFAGKYLRVRVADEKQKTESQFLAKVAALKQKSPSLYQDLILIHVMIRNPTESSTKLSGSAREDKFEIMRQVALEHYRAGHDFRELAVIDEKELLKRMPKKLNLF